MNRVLGLQGNNILIRRFVKLIYSCITASKKKTHRINKFAINSEALDFNYFVK